MTSALRESSGLSNALAASALVVGLACAATAIRSARAGLRAELRRAASCATEYHIALHVPRGSCGSAARSSRDALEWSCKLVRVSKTAGIEVLRSAIVSALQTEGATPESIGRAAFFPVHRCVGGGGHVGRCLPQDSVVAHFESLLANRPSEELQVVELVIVLEASEPSSISPPPAPPAIQAFPTPRLSLPVLGHRYVLKGSEDLASLNLANWLFPTDGTEFPFGETVRTYSGGWRSSIDDFKPGSVFHEHAECYRTWTADPRLVEEVLHRNEDFPKLWNHKGQKTFADWMGYGMFTSSETSEDWQTGHSVLPKVFNQFKIKRFAPKVLAKVRAFVKVWSRFPAGHRIPDVPLWMSAMTADAVISCLVGFDMENVERMGRGEESHPIMQHFRFGLGVASKSRSAATEYGLWRFVPGFGAKRRVDERYEKAKAYLHEAIADIIERTRSGELGDESSVVRAMLEDRAADGKYMRLEALHSHMINLMTAGHETTASTLGFLLQLLATHPDVEARAYQELRGVLGDRTELMFEDVSRLHYLEQCFREALRLYTPLDILGRDAAHDTMLQGRRVYQGERITIVSKALHRHPEHWGGEFGDTASFNPDRFSPEAVAKRHPRAYAPWGFGSRACIAQQFALFEAKAFVASLLLHFKLEAVPGYHLRPSNNTGGASLTAHRLELFIQPRPGGPAWAPDGSMRRVD